ncbi:MAG: type II toxin-antitoxin system Phd/YefM family antitoxin [Candidatus Omnitrophota bacterium]
MRLSAAKLKEELFNVLDEVLEKGTPVEIERKGRILKIVAEPKESKLKKLEPHDAIVGAPESILNIDWSREWKGENSL